jgi:hypothetical protein
MKVLLDNKSFEVKSLTIEQYLALKENPDLKDYELIHILTGIPIEEILQAPMSDVKFVANMLLGEYAQSEDLTELDLDLEIDGVLYGLIRPSKMSYEEWINMEVFMTESPINLPKIATHLYRPLASDKLGEERELIKYSLEECSGREELFRKKFKMNKLTTALFFLTTFAQKLTENFLSSIPNKQKKKKIQEMERELRLKKLSNPLLTTTTKR